jgi:hypothetical protein
VEDIAQNNNLACTFPYRPIPTPPTLHDDDDATVTMSNCTHANDKTPASTTTTSADSTIATTEETIFNASGIIIAGDQAIADAGATGHFILPGTPVSDIQPASKPLAINLPNGEKIMSTHTCRLNVPWLPEKAREAHIVPGLAHASLVSIKILCDAGCRVIYDDNACRVYYNEKIVWIGHREPSTGLWVLPLNPTQQATRLPHLRAKGCDTTHATNNAYTMTSKESLIKYLHQCLFSPPKRTLIKAINNKQFTTWPGLTAKAVQQYLPDAAPATDKGHMKRQKQGIRSTKEKLQQEIDKIETARDMNPPQEKETQNQLFCYTGGIDKKDGTIYVDFTGKFPIRSMDGMTAIFILYDWTTNAILATPVKDGKEETTIATFEEKIQYLTKRGFKPVLNIIDNVASKAIQAHLEANNIKIQLVEPHNHRVNAAERAIQTFKNHMIAGLSTCDSQFPSLLWDRLVPQAQDSLNMLRTSRVHPQLSAYHVLEGTHDYNRVPWAPPGTRATIFNPPETRTSWGPRAIDAWYIGQAPNHYRCYNFYIPATGGTRTSGQATFYPQHCSVPHETPMDETRRVAETLIQAVQKLRNEQTQQPGRHTAALQQLAEIFQDETGQIARVDVNVTQTSTNPTNPATVRAAPRVHNRTTRNNTPGRIPTNVTTNETPVPPTVKPTETNSEGAHRAKRQRPIVPATPVNESQRRSPRLTPQQPLQQQQHVQQTKQPASPRRPAATPNFITQEEASNAMNLDSNSQPAIDIEHFCAPVVHPITGETIHTYPKLAKDPATREVWTTAFGKEFGNLAQGDNKTGTAGTDSIFIIERDEIANIPKDRTVTYARVVVDYRPQKEDPNRVRITAGGNLIQYPGELTTRTADLTTAKILWNSVVSTEDAKYMCVDIKNFYLGTPLDRYEYMRIPLTLFPEHIIEQYNLRDKAKDGYVYLECRKAIYGLPQAGILANKLLKARLAPAGYYEVPHTPGLWTHISRPISFTLVVDDFGVKYVGKQHAEHLVQAIKKHYPLSEDWAGTLYCGITLAWDYDARTVDFSMPGYIKKQLQKYQHEKPTRPQHSPYPAATRTYGASAQNPLPTDESPPAGPDGVSRTQKIVGSILYYARAVDMTVLMSLSTIASEQANATQQTITNTEQLLDYLATNPDATMRFKASDMILNIHADASYLSARGGKSRASGHFFLGWNPTDDQPIRLNGAFFTLCCILKFVAASAAEAELGALFMCAKEGRIYRLTLQELGHPQPPTPIHCDNATAAGIANGTVKKQRSRSMEMRYFYICDQVKNKEFDVRWHPGQENLGDYASKHHEGRHHKEVRPIYLHEQDSPTLLPRALRPSALRGCVGIKPLGHVGRPRSVLPSGRALVPRTQ